MEMILKNPTERELVRARMDALIDQRTQINSALRRGRQEGRLEGRQEGRLEGRLEGQIESLSALVRKGRITISEAAEEANLSVHEFAQKAGLPVPN